MGDRGYYYQSINGTTHFVPFQEDKILPISSYGKFVADVMVVLLLADHNDIQLALFIVAVKKVHS